MFSYNRNSRAGIFLLAIAVFFTCRPESGTGAPLEARPGEARATFAGGCFWCMEPPFEKLPGVLRVISGFTGGPEKNPSYKQVAGGYTGHTEAVQIFFDPKKISYEKLLEVFWRQIDPTDRGGQFVDRGSQYRTGIFYHDEAQRKAAERSKQKLIDSKRFPKPIVTPVEKAGPFYAAEDYHQDFYKKNPDHYYRYRRGSGRDQFIERFWGDAAAVEKNEKEQPEKATAGRKGGAFWESFRKPGADELEGKLSGAQFYVTQQDGTEPPFRNEYWDNKKDGIYVDVVSGEPLFSSTDKFRSGTGWPSFTKPIVPGLVVRKEDRSHGMVRVEVRSKYGDSHLGHVFDDGPPPTGLRYCINSASLKFVPKEKLDDAGYGQFKKLFL